MKAMIIKNFGDSDVFEPAQIDKPMVKPGHVLVKIAATSINTVDTMIRQMGEELPISPELPAVLGMDFAGTIEEVGEGVSEYAVGDEVYGCAGGLGEECQKGCSFKAIHQDDDKFIIDPTKCDVCGDCYTICPSDAIEIVIDDPARQTVKKSVYSAEVLGQSTLPGLNGTYDRVTCIRKMDKDIQDAIIAVPANDEEHVKVMKAIDEFEEGVSIKTRGDRPPNYCVKYCRRCELACLVGK